MNIAKRLQRILKMLLGIAKIKFRMEGYLLYLTLITFETFIILICLLQIENHTAVLQHLI